MEDLLALALSDPGAAEARARQVTAVSSDPHDRSTAHQALGIALRDQGRLEPALEELRAALVWARRGGDSGRLADVHATYGGTLVIAGRSRSGLRQLDRAVRVAPTPMTLLRRGIALLLVGRHRESEADLVAALDGFRAVHEPVGEARAQHNLGYLALTAGRVDDAERHTTAAAELFARSGLEVEALLARQNLGEIAYARGDLPRALAVYAEVAREYDVLGQELRDIRPHLATARCQAYLAAGLVAEAAAVVDAELAVPDTNAVDRATLQMRGAQARLDGAEPELALVLGYAARDAFRKHDDSWYETRARLVLVRASARLGRGGRRTAGEAVRVADLLDAERADEAPVALIVASRIADADRRPALLARAAAYRTRRTDLVRASGWLAHGLERELSGDRGGVLRACGRGLAALDDHRRLLGSTELRALATGHGTELAALALRHAADQPRSLLRWSERWRSTALAQAPVTPGGRPVVESLVALRDVTRRLSEARVEGEPTEDLEKERSRLERVVRAEHHQVAGRADETPAIDVDELVGRVGDGTLVELVDVDGVLHVLLVHRGRVRRYVAGTSADALALAESARFLLRRSARGRPYAPGDLGTRLEQVLLGDAARLLPEGPVVVAPTARLHGVPWALLPVLAGRPFGVVPSAAQWLRARDARPRHDGGVALLAGPGLGTGGAEVPVLARRHPDAVHLTGEAATVDAALSALDGARLAHVAAHGRFRADSPLFSALDMADGPLTVHDLERLTAAPHRVVLSACESGVLAPVGADELLGLASALFALGSAGLVCSVAEVNDVATAELMVDLHAHLDRGADPATALHALRQGAEGDVAAATAAAFVSLGV
ncbi:CHAT domain-containing tetratricopeptide repeat protein [Nocardioides sp.]|uniref:CHAT domain-containing protein n=1 Tax=Nocardioides sp. TaxID=35761 RepID=UPI0025E3D153|nr:CHAT domain-containing tetratricopeptide repeat protein [Nocardioides sp.]